MTEQQLKTLRAVLDDSREYLHKHSLTVLARKELITFTDRGNGWVITDTGLKVLNNEKPDEVLA